MSRYLIVGDIHMKPHILDKARELYNKGGIDKVILMGDYMDDWNDSNILAFEMLATLNEFMEEIPTIALIGNHELAYLEGQHYGGWTGGKQVIFNQLFDREKFTLSFQEGDWLFTHAGLTARWARYASTLDIEPNNKNDMVYLKIEDYENISAWLNDLWKRYPGIFKSIGKARGGFGHGSPLWADWSELVADTFRGVNQIVGHTPHQEVQMKRRRTVKLWCVDVWSNDAPGGFLIWEDGNIINLDSTGKRIRKPTT